MGKILLSEDAESSPPGIGNPVVLARQTFLQERIPNGAWKGNVNDSAGVNVTDFRRSKPEFTPAKAVWVNGYSCPRRYFLLNLLEVPHSELPFRFFDASTGPLDAAGILTCLSCHDGYWATGAMMQNKVYETVPSSYACNNIPTLLVNDGNGTGDYLNDHPVGLNAAI
jgi:hypothetical protein